MGPLTEKQKGVLVALLAIAEGPRPYLHYPAPPADIAAKMQASGTLTREAIIGGRGDEGRGRGHRVFNPAQRIITPLTGLRERGLVSPARRPDGRSGTAYRLTYGGERLARQLGAEQ